MKKPSPAVASLNEERKQAQDKPELEDELEQTFPASDPPSATSTTVAGDREETGKDNSKTNAERSGAQAQQISSDELREKLNDMTDALEDLSLTARAYVAQSKRNLSATARDEIRRQPWRAIALSALVGYLIGLR